MTSFNYSDVSTLARHFSTNAIAGDARTGYLQVGENCLETPNLYPVLNFYAGGRARSLYGGGIFRTLKELITGQYPVEADVDVLRYFDATMTSIASITDYRVNEDLYQEYVAAPIKSRSEFEPFDGLVFIDSGGYKLLTSDPSGESHAFEEMDQARAFRLQKQLGADVIVNLDRPIAPTDSYATRCEKAAETAQNVAEFLDLSADYDGARYLTVHGYNYSMLDRYLTEVTEQLGTSDLATLFDGVALGSLVPVKNNRSKLIQAVSDCKKIMAERGLADLPLHVMGISKQSIPLLVAVGADTFDSSSYVQSAIHGKYMTSLCSTKPLNEVDFSMCECPVCTSVELRDQMMGNSKYQKDILGPVAMHNLIIVKQELAEIRNRIKQPGTNPLIDYLETTFRDNVQTRKYAFQVIYDSLGGSF